MKKFEGQLTCSLDEPEMPGSDATTAEIVQYVNDWSNWLDDCVYGTDSSGDGGGGTPPECQPIPCHEFNGRWFEVVCTSSGPELRLCHSRPVIFVPPSTQRSGDTTIIISVAVTRKGYLVGTQNHEGIQPQLVPFNTIRLSHLLGSMYNQSSLPHKSLEKIPQTFWKEQTEIVRETLFQPVLK